MKNSLNYECTRSLLISCIWILKNIDKQSLLQLWVSIGPARLSQLLDLFYLCLVNFEYKVGTALSLLYLMLTCTAMLQVRYECLSLAFLF